MLLHGCHNAMLVLVGWWQAQQEPGTPGVMDIEHLPWHWLVAGAVGVLAGVGLMVICKRRPESSAQADEILVAKIAE